jgi:hypothetical protein
MRDREDARLAAQRGPATHVPPNAWTHSGGSADEQPGEAVSFGAAGGQSYRAADRDARVRQTGNGRNFSGKMTRAANKLDDRNSGMSGRAVEAPA